MLGILKVFIVLLCGIVNGSKHKMCMFLSNQKCMTQPNFINLYLNEYSQELHYYPFAVKLDKYVGRCNALNDLSNKAYLPTSMLF